MLRTTEIAQPSSWMAWNGVGFSARPASGYSITDDPANHVCKPVAGTMQPFSLTYNRYLRKYMLLAHGRPPGATSADWWTFYLLSDDLVNWSEPQLLMRAPSVREDENCNLDSVAYPVLLDPSDPAAAATGTANRNFDHPGRAPDLYFRLHPRDPGPNPGDPCVEPKARLARLPIQFQHRRAVLKDNLIGDDYGYDATQGTDASQFTAATGPEEDYDDDPDVPNKFAKARTAVDTGSRWSYGTLNANDLKDGDDVWYGSAFWLPSNFAAANTVVDLIRWETDTGFHGAIRHLPPNATYPARFRLVRAGPPGVTYLGPPAGFVLPAGRWFWLEVHQKLGNSAGGGTLNEVYVDGRLVMTSTEANRGAVATSDSSPIKRIKYGIVNNSSPAGTDTTILVDRSSITGGPLGAIGAPATPQGLRTVFSNATLVALTANAVTSGNPSGYRFYKRENGVWVKLGESTTPNWITSVVSCSVNEFRISAYRAGTPSSSEQESIASAPLTVDGCPD